MSKNNLKTALLAGTAAAALIAADMNSASAQMYSTGPGFYLSLEGRYLWGRGDKIRAFDAGVYTFGTIATPGPAARAEKGWGGKAMLGYRFNNNWDIGLGLSGGWLKGKKSGIATATTGITPDAAILTVGVESKIKVKLRYEVADFEAGYNMQMGSNSTARLFGGVRFAHFNQTAKANAFATTTISSIAGATGKRKTTYWGVGPRLGLNGQLGIGNSGFNVFGGISGALLFGKFKDKHNAAFVTAGGSPTSGTSIRDKRKSRMVPNAEGEIGLGYNFNAGRGSTVGIQLGYRAEKWWGVSSDSTVLTTAVASHKSDQMMHGPFVRLTATFGSAPAAPVAAPPPPPPPAARKSFIVFFDFDRSNITAQAQATINDAVAAAKAGNSTRITLTGHTDRSGSEQYNQALSIRRGEAVKAAMIRGGIPASAIVVIGRGESQPLVPTADGVREPQNRRVEIVI